MFFYKKKLGQNFVIDNGIAQNIIKILKNNENIVEIGPGNGALTNFLYKKYQHNLHLIELDDSLIPILKQKFPLSNIYNENVLNFNFNDIGKHINIIGNFPYNISHDIIFKIIENRSIIDQVICMLQYEVVERITAKPKTKSYGIPTVLVNAFFNTQLMFTVDKQNFYPVPKVQSAILQMTNKNITDLGCNETSFFKTVKLAFSQKRKILKNNLKSVIDTNNVNDTYINSLMQNRAEELSIDDFIKLTNYIDVYRKN